MAIKVNQQAITQNKDDCKIGYSCGLACISKDKVCLKKIGKENTRLLKRIEDLILLRSQASGDDIEVDEKIAKAFAKIRGHIDKVIANSDEAYDYRDAICKVRPNSKACTDAEEAAIKAQDAIEDIPIILNNIRDTLARTGRNVDQVDALTITDDDLNNLKENHLDNINLQKDIEQISKKYQENWEKIRGDLDAERQLFKNYDIELKNAYEKAGIKNPGDIYITQELVDGVYDLLPPRLQRYLNNAGSIGKSLGLSQLIHGSEDFNEDGLWVGDRGKVLNQRREGQWVDSEGNSQSTNKNPSGVNRGKSGLEIFLRTQGISPWTDNKADISTMELEHINPWGKNKSWADSWGQIGWANKNENIWKGEKSIEDWGEIYNNLNSAEERNSGLRTNADKSKKSKGKAETYVNDNGSINSLEGLKLSSTEDKQALKVLNSLKKSNLVPDNWTLKNLQENITSGDIANDGNRFFVSLFTDMNTAKGSKDIMKRLLDEDGNKLPNRLTDQRRTNSLKTTGSRVVTALILSGQNIDINGESLKDRTIRAHKRAMTQIKNAQRQDIQNGTTLELKDTAKNRYDRRVYEELEKEGIPLDDYLNLVNVKR